MASEGLYCMECVEGRAVALGLCSHCLAGEPVEAVVGQIARLARELEEARERLQQYQRLVVFADSVARARGDACGLCDALGRDGQPYQSHRAADLIAEAERALTARPPDTRNHPTSPLRSPQ